MKETNLIFCDGKGQELMICRIFMNLYFSEMQRKSQCKAGARPNTKYLRNMGLHSSRRYLL